MTGIYRGQRRFWLVFFCFVFASLLLLPYGLYILVFLHNTSSNIEERDDEAERGWGWEEGGHM